MPRGLREVRLWRRLIAVIPAFADSADECGSAAFIAGRVTPAAERLALFLRAINFVAVATALTGYGFGSAFNIDWQV